MEPSLKNERLTLSLSLTIDNYTTKILQEFNLHNNISNLSQGTVKFYDGEVRRFIAFLDTQGVYTMNEITPTILRQYLLLVSTRRNAGGVHAVYRALRCWFNFYIREYDQTEWENPCTKVKVKKPNLEPIQGVTVDQLEAMLKVCQNKRDIALLKFLFASGVRRAELCALNVGDVSADGAVRVLKGKGNKWRICFVDKGTFRSLKQYLRQRENLQRENLTEASPLFANREGERLTVDGLSSLIKRIAHKAGLDGISCHDFRRGFGAHFVASGGSVGILKELLGHSSVTTTERYYKLNEQDLRNGYHKVWGSNSWGYHKAWESNSKESRSKEKHSGESHSKEGHSW